MDKARDAFADRNVEASAAFHLLKHKEAEKKHGGAGSDRIKSIVFGGLDGVITSAAVVFSVAGSSLPLQIVIVTGIAKLLGDGLAMGIGDAISEGAEIAFIRGEREREAWEFKNFPEGEVAEMEKIYTEKGFTPAEAHTVMAAMTRKPEYAEYFVDHMMVQELGALVPSPDEQPWKDGLVTFASFMTFGFLPILPYIIFWAAGYHSASGQLGICAAVSLLALFALGGVQAKIIRQSIVKQGLLMAINGGMAGAAAYAVGLGLQKAFGVQENPCS